MSSISTCNHENPVRYLVNQPKLLCPIKVGPDTCASSIFNFKSYNSAPQVLMNRTSDAVPVTSIEYWRCDSYKSPSEPTEQLPNPNLSCQSPSGSQCTFDSNSKVFDENPTGLCSSSTWTYSADRVNDIPLDFYSQLFSQCTRVTSVPEPVPQAGNICQNAVIAVKNLFFWKERVITRIITQIVIADILYPTSPSQEFNQVFELKWIHDSFNVNSIGQYNDLVVSSEYLRKMKNGLKGKASNRNNTQVSGYIYGSTIVSGYKADKGSKDLVDITYKQRISAFNVLNGKLCGKYSNLERMEIKFNQNLSSSCFVRVTRPEVEKRCHCLRNLVFNKINDYFVPSNLISRNGNPNMTHFNKSEWVDVFPASRKFQSLNQTTQSVCPGVPYKVTVEFLYARVGMVGGNDFNELIGTYLR